MADRAEVFRTLFLDNPMPMWLYDPKSLGIVDVNKAAIQHYGWSRKEFLSLNILQVRPAEDVFDFQNALRKSSKVTGTRQMRGLRHRRKDGSIIWVDVYSRIMKFEGRTLRIAMLHDVTAMRDVADRLERQSVYFRQLFEVSPDAILMLDPDDRVVDANGAFTTLFGYTADEVKGHFVTDFLVPPDRIEESRQMSRSALANTVVQRESVRRRKDGSLVEVSVVGYPITAEGRQVGVYAIYRDMTESKRIAAQLAYHATHDTLTGLLNRHEFERQAEAMLFAASGERRHCLLFLDLDQFKVVNESLGRNAGDQVLVEVAELLRAQLHDQPGHVLGRIGGDKFGVLLRQVPDAEAEKIARRVIKCIREQRFRIDGRSLSLGMSAGLVELGAWPQSLAELLSSADTACLTAKETRRGGVQVFRPDDQELLRRRGVLSWASRITDALENGRFELYYQRIVPVHNPRNAPLRYEVLLRLPEGERTMALPGPFISAAERYGLMPSVDRHVVTRILDRLQKGVQRQRLPHLVSVNLSGTSISEEGFGTYLREQISRRGIPPQILCFEITETSAIENLSRALNFIRKMREYGCSIALDDFGSGMSSFSYLKSLAVDYLKIDGSFIRDMVSNSLDSAMTEAINKVGQVKGIKTIAEYVEDVATLRRLAEIGVNYAQGFHIHQPEPWDLEANGAASTAHEAAGNG